MTCTGTNEQLIEQFVTGPRGDAEQAFGFLVERHGPMVMGVCRQVLDRHHDAEDAFQATFLALARKAGSIHNRRVLGCWLHEVAYRIAIRMRTQVARRVPPHIVADRAVSIGAPEIAAVQKELGMHVHAEVGRLPQKYRSLVVQCYLEGKTDREVAQLLNRPVGTVKGWLSRARGMLRQRLSGTALDPNSVGAGSGRVRRASNPLVSIPD